MSRPSLGRNVIALGVVSFFTDASSEMIYPLLPVFLTATLGASARMLGAIEGAAETTASLLKLASGWWSDRVQRRKPLVVIGYSLASLARPLVAAAQSAGQVMAIRLADRIGKGMRSSPRDALVSESVHPSVRGRAFGFQRAADHAGAVVGPLVAFVLLQWLGLELRTVFWLAFVPGALAVITVVFFVSESRELSEASFSAGRANDEARPDSYSAALRAGERPPRRRRAENETAAASSVAAAAENAVPLRRSFWAYLGVLLVFTLGNSTDAFLLLRASQLGVPLAMLPVLWAALHVVKSAGSTHGGALSDSIGRAPTLMAGWGIYAAVYLGFAFASVQWHAWALFLTYGAFFALTEGTERALVSDFVPAAKRGTAFGWYHLIVGLGALPASVLFGFLWDSFGAHVAFMVGAALAAVAAVGIGLIPKPGISEPG